jgi:hypothetical protein
MKLATLTVFRDGSMSLSESFDPDDPNLIDRFPDHPPETDIQLFHSLLVSSVSVGFFDVGCIPPVYVHLVCVDRSLFFVNTVGMLMSIINLLNGNI